MNIPFLCVHETTDIYLEITTNGYTFQNNLLCPNQTFLVFNVDGHILHIYNNVF